MIFKLLALPFRRNGSNKRRDAAITVAAIVLAAVRIDVCSAGQPCPTGCWSIGVDVQQLDPRPATDFDWILQSSDLNQITVSPPNNASMFPFTAFQQQSNGATAEQVNYIQPSPGPIPRDTTTQYLFQLYGTGPKPFVTTFWTYAGDQVYLPGPATGMNFTGEPSHTTGGGVHVSNMRTTPLGLSALGMLVTDTEIPPEKLNPTDTPAASFSQIDLNGDGLTNDADLNLMGQPLGPAHSLDFSLHGLDSSDFLVLYMQGAFVSPTGTDYPGIVRVWEEISLAPVPEPASWLLLMIGACYLVQLRKLKT